MLNREKQNVAETSCTEYSIYGLIEMIHQFPGDLLIEPTFNFQA